ncbi:MAG TPA: type VI secretion system tube protein Hcp [Woeseiaceae bacterium]
MSALALAFALLATPGIAAAAGYLKIGDIQGESTNNKDHSDEIELLSWSWGETSTNRSSGRPTGKRQHKPFVITKPVDQASPLLQQASISGKAIPSMELALPKKDGGSDQYTKYKLKNVYVTSYAVRSSGNGGRALQTEVFTLSYEESTEIPARISKGADSGVQFVAEPARAR